MLDELHTERAARAIQVRADLIASGCLVPADTPGRRLPRVRTPATWLQDAAGYLSAAAEIHRTEPVEARRIREHGSGAVADLLRQMHASDSHG